MWLKWFNGDIFVVVFFMANLQILRCYFCDYLVLVDSISTALFTFRRRVQWLLIGKHRATRMPLRIAWISRQQFPRSILATSSSTHPARGCYEDVARVGRLPRSACHTLTWLAGRRSAAVYADRLSVCRVVLQIPRARPVIVCSAH